MHHRILKALRRLPCSAFAACLLFAAHSLPAHAAEPLYVKVRSTKLRAAAAPLAAAVATLQYGDRLEKLGEERGWVKVRTGRSTGYLHSSAVTDRVVVLSSSRAPVSGTAESSDVVLAGKGFNREVEKQYAAQNRGLNFSAVDEMERRTVSDSDLSAFVREGALRREG